MAILILSQPLVEICHAEIARFCIVSVSMMGGIRRKGNEASSFRRKGPDDKHLIWKSQKSPTKMRGIYDGLVISRPANY